MGRIVRSRGTWLLAAVMVGLVASCDGDEGSDGDESDGDESDGDGEELERLYPGPCTAERHLEDGPIDMECSFGYDEADLLTSIDCAALDESEAWQVRRVFSGDELVEVSRVYQLRREPTFGGEVDEEETWTLGETVTRTAERVTDTRLREIVESYESDGFQLHGHPFDPERILAAPDSLIESSETTTILDEDPPAVTTVEIEYTYDGPPHEGTRTRSASEGRPVVFRYDAAGRLIEVMSSSSDGYVMNRTSNEYDGELLATIRISSIIKGASDDVATEFEHDSHGNLIERRWLGVDPPIAITEFDYGCWEE